MPLSPEEREEKIRRILADDKPVKKGEKIIGSSTAYDVFAIPLDCVTYNSKNTRFKSEALTFKAANNSDLDVENTNHYKLIEDYIWKQNEARNKDTIQSLIKDTQQKPGIITRDGVVISGNRRLRLINEIHRNPNKYQSDIPFFEAIVLEEKEMSRDRIIELETYYQFAEDEKVEYDPIQKYLAVHEQHIDDHVSVEKLAKNYKKNERKILEWLDIYDLMTEYLEYHGVEGHYDQLKNLEDPFIGLNAKLKKLEKGGGKSIDWPYEEEDVEVLKELYFDYLWGKVFTKEKSYREILKFFDMKSAWEKLTDRYNKSVSNNDRLSVQEVKNKNPELSEKEVIKKTSAEFTKAHSDDLKLALGVARLEANVKEIMGAPADLAEQARSNVVSLKDAVQKLKKSKRPIQEKRRLSLMLKTIRNITKDIEEIIWSYDKDE